MADASGTRIGYPVPALESEPENGIELPQRRTQRKTRARYHAYPAPDGIDRLERARYRLSRSNVPVLADDPAVQVTDRVWRAGKSLLYQLEDRLQYIDRLESRDDGRHASVPLEHIVPGSSEHGAHMSGENESVHLRPGSLEQKGQGWRYEPQ